jgi:hypothetical protein
MGAAAECKPRYRYRYMDDPLSKYMYHMQVHSMIQRQSWPLEQVQQLVKKLSQHMSRFLG